jgi:hypothetical protein
MQEVDLKILEEILTSHLIIGKGGSYLELLKNKYERDTYLTGVRKIILIEKYSTELLSDFFVSYGFSDYFSEIYSIKEEYFEKISEEIFLGYISPEFSSLIDSDTIALKEHLEYLSYLNLAYKFQGRKELKEHLFNLEALSKFDISEDVIKNGVKVQIRNDLKARLNELEKSENNHVIEEKYFNEIISKSQIPLSKSQINSDSYESIISNNSTSVKKYSFTKYALAALFIGFISITTILYNYKNNDYKENFARNTDTKNNEALIDSNTGLFKIDKQQRESLKNYGLSMERDSINANAKISKGVTYKYRYNFTILLIIVGILSVLLYLLKKRKK